MVVFSCLSVLKRLRKRQSASGRAWVYAQIKNLWYMALVIFFIEIFRLMWYMIIGAGYMLYFICAAIYKIYYCMVKGTVLGYRKLHPRKKNKTAA